MVARAGPTGPAARPVRGRTANRDGGTSAGTDRYPRVLRRALVVRMVRMRWGAVMHQFEAYVETGVVTGALATSEGAIGALREGVPITLDEAVWYPMDGGPPEQVAHVEIPQDDALVLAVDATDVPVHATWHPILLDIGPYRVVGELSTPPGFDPGRALARPGGVFLAIRDAVVELRGRGGVGRVERPSVLVNRYAVDRVVTDLVLGFFFPGARLETAQDTAPV